MRHTTGRAAGALLILALVCAGSFIGCKSTSEKKSPPASGVIFSGNTPGQISEMIVTVFRENGYTLAQPGMTKLVFEKKAGLTSNIAYGNWISDKPIYIRARISISPTSEMAYAADVRTVLVRDINGTTEEELKLGGGQQHESRKLVEEAAKRLGRPAHN